jgi:hypothetical protein
MHRASSVGSIHDVKCISQFRQVGQPVRFHYWVSLEVLKVDTQASFSTYIFSWPYVPEKLRETIKIPKTTPNQ